MVSNTITGEVRMDGSAVRLNEQYALTAGHCVGYSANDPFISVSHGTADWVWIVGTGNHELTNRGVVRVISNALIYPGYTGDVAQSPDMAILKFDHPLEGKDLVLAYPIAGEQLTGCGFGSQGLIGRDDGVNIYNLPNDRKRRAWDMTAGFGGGPNYLEMWFGYSGSYNSLTQGAAAPGDSGSPLFNSQGELVALNVAATTRVGWPNGQATWSIELAPYADWIATNSAVTMPTLFTRGNGPDMVLTWGGNYTLQSSTNLTTGYTTVTGATSPYTNTLTGDPQRFFRLYAESNTVSSLISSNTPPQLRVQPLATPAANTNSDNTVRGLEIVPL